MIEERKRVSVPARTHGQGAEKRGEGRGQLRGRITSLEVPSRVEGLRLAGSLIRALVPGLRGALPFRRLGPGAAAAFIAPALALIGAAPGASPGRDGIDERILRRDALGLEPGGAGEPIGGLVLPGPRGRAAHPRQGARLGREAFAKQSRHGESRKSVVGETRAQDERLHGVLALGESTEDEARFGALHSRRKHRPRLEPGLRARLHDQAPRADAEKLRSEAFQDFHGYDGAGPETFPRTGAAYDEPRLGRTCDTHDRCPSLSGPKGRPYSCAV